MESTYNYNYIPSYIVRNWADKDDKVKFNTSFETATYVSPVAEMYIEELSVGRGLDPESSNFFLYKPLVEDMITLSKGNSSPLEKDLFNVCVFLMFIYHTNPYGYGRYVSFMADELCRMDTTQEEEWSIEMLSDKVRERLNENRGVVELLKKQSEAFLMAPYIMDLKAVIVEAGSPMGFLLSASPLFFGNPYNKAAFNDIMEPYTRRGAVFFMPLSPRFAICLYDGDIYKVNKTEGRVLLTGEDTLLINSYIINVADDVCYTSEDKDYLSFKEKAFSGVYDVGSFNPTFLSMKNKLPSDKDVKREHPELMSSYDNEHFSSLSGENKIPSDFYTKRMEYVYSILKNKG